MSKQTAEQTHKVKSDKLYKAFRAKLKPVQHTYETSRTQNWDEYEANCIPFLAEYKSKTAPLLEKYKRKYSVILKKYNEELEALNAEYKLD